MSIDWSQLLGLGANAATGGILGILGSGLTGIVSIFQARAQFAHDEKMADLNLQLIKANSDAASKAAADQLASTSEQNAGAAFTASQMAGNTFANLPGFFSGILSMVRPTLTFISCWLVWYCYTHEVDQDTRRAIIASVLTLNAMAWGWWFGDRQISKMVATKYVNLPATNQPATK